MTQFFNRIEAEDSASEFKSRFPHVRVWSVLDIINPKTKEYERSFFTVSIDDSPLVTIGSTEQLKSFFRMCQYISSAIADNQQSEEYASNQLIAMRPPTHGPECCCNLCDPNEREYPQGKSFTDQNGLTVLQGGVYGVDEQGDLYDIEPLVPFRSSEY